MKALDEAIKKMRGEPHTRITLTVARKTARGDVSDLSQEAARAGFQPSEVAGRLIGNVKSPKFEVKFGAHFEGHAATRA